MTTLYGYKARLVLTDDEGRDFEAGEEALRGGTYAGSKVVNQTVVKRAIKAHEQQFPPKPPDTPESVLREIVEARPLPPYLSEKARKVLGEESA